MPTVTSGVPRADRVPVRYKAFVPARIAGADLAMPLRLASEIEGASLAVLELNAGPASGGLDALAGALVRSESVASSRIEALAVSHRRVAEAIASPALAKGAALEVANNVAAMQRAIASADRPGQFGIEDLLGIHGRLLAGTRHAGIAGVLRQEQSWIGGPSGYSPRGALYVPPPCEEVAALLDDLVVFVNRTDVPAVAQAAIVHAQFEAIHPFVDGNGRVGRCLVPVVLRRRGLSSAVVPPISAAMLADRDGYFASLAAYQQRGDVLGWLSYFAATTRSAAEAAGGLADRLAALRTAWTEMAGRPRHNSVVARAIGALAGQPLLSATTLAGLLGVDPNVARRALNALNQAGVVELVSKGERNRIWAADAVFDLLDDFEHTVTRGRGPTRHLRLMASSTSQVVGTSAL